jgi:hypothetical protein
MAATDIRKFPLDTLKTRLQAATAETLPAYHLGTIKGYRITSETVACTQNIYRTEGLQAFWRGMTPRKLCLAETY